MISRRDFVKLAGAALALPPDAPSVRLQPDPAGGFRRQAGGVRFQAEGSALDLAEWNYYWVGVERAELARGTICDGTHLYVEYAIPRVVRQRWPVVLIHGGAGQGTDWMTTPDGRPGWATLLLQEGYIVYVVDRPAQGRPAFHPNVNGDFPPQAPTYQAATREIPELGGPSPRVLDQFVASLGPAMPINARTQNVWREKAGQLLDEVGPAVLMTHGDSSAFGWLAVQARPDLVKAIVAVVPAQLPQGEARNIPVHIVTPTSPEDGPYVMMQRDNRAALQPVLGFLATQFGAMSATSPGPKTPPVNPQPGDSVAMRLADHGHFWTGVQQKKMPYGVVATGQMFVQYFIPAERRQPYPIVLVHGGGGQATHFMGIGRRPGWLHFFVQQGYSVYLVDRPGFGRSPYHPDTLGPSHLRNFPAYEGFAASPAVMNTVRWPGNHVIGEDPLVDQFMANEVSNVSDEAYHSELSEKGAVELLDRIGPSIVLTHAFGGFLGWIMADRRPNLVKAILAMEINGNPFLNQLRWGVTAVPLAYDPPAASPADFNLVDVPVPPDSPRTPLTAFKLQAAPARKLKNLQGIPIAWLTGEFGGGGLGHANVEFLKQAGCRAELIRLRDLGIHGNGNLMLMETNNRQVFDVARGWFEKNVR
jgi:pimeloyl-ACP methyl ester carboxylesterase